MRPYINDLTQITPSFPASVYQPVPRRNRSTQYTAVAESGAVSGLEHGYSILLNEAIVKQAPLSVYDDTTGEWLVVVPIADTPNAAQVAVDYDIGRLSFHSSRAGHTITVGYNPGGTPYMADVDMQYQAELAAMQQYIADGNVFSGPQGPQGLSGGAGPSGGVGAQGPQGLSGVGSQGVQGNQGVFGAQGFQGAIGPQGLTGTTGATGAQGPQGRQGNQGLTGTAGPQGLTGATGSTGATGAQGPQGRQGNQGATGATGSAGPQGFTGTTGSIGPQGRQGVQGPQGRQGNQGNNGSTGPSGAQGPQGAYPASVPDEALSANIPMFDMANWNTPSIVAAGDVSAESFTGPATGLTSIPAGQLTGSIADARLSSNIPRFTDGNWTVNNITVSGSVSGDSLAVGGYPCTIYQGDDPLFVNASVTSDVPFSGTFIGGDVYANYGEVRGGIMKMTNGTSNLLDLGNVGVAAPGSNSAGMRLRFYRSGGNGNVNTMNYDDYAMGIEGSTLWFNSSFGYKWYRQSSLAMSLDENGKLQPAALNVVSNTSNPLMVARKSNSDHTLTTTLNNSYYLKLGGAGYATNSYRLIGMGYCSSDTAAPPVFIGYKEATDSGSTKGDLVFGTRDSISAIDPTVRMTISADGNVAVANNLTVSGKVVVGKKVYTNLNGSNYGSDATAHTSWASAYTLEADKDLILINSWDGVTSYDVYCKLPDPTTLDAGQRIRVRFGSINTSYAKYFRVTTGSSSHYLSVDGTYYAVNDYCWKVPFQRMGCFEFVVTPIPNQNRGGWLVFPIYMTDLGTAEAI